jgi:electron transfer flavoprotein beta subunit
MKIIVLIKKTPDTEAIIKCSGSKLDLSGVKYIINPYDEYAIEEALRIKEKNAECEVVVACLGDAAVKELIIKGLAMGADRGVWIEAQDGLDSMSVAKALAKFIEGENPKLVFTGRHAIDDDNMHVQAMVAEKLGWPHVNVITKCDFNGDHVVVERAVEGAQVEVYKASLPCILGADKSLNQPRYTSLPNIMKAKKKPMDEKKTEELLGGSVTTSVQITAYEMPPEKPKGKMFQGEPVDAMVAKVVGLLRSEAKVV